MAVKKKILRFSFITLLILVIGAAGVGYYIYKEIYSANVFLDGKKSLVIFVPTGSDYKQLLNILNENKVIKDQRSFDWVAEKKKYKSNVKPGRYRVLAGMSNDELVNMLRSGNQEPITLTFNNIHTKQQLAGRVGSKLEADSTELLKMLNDADYLKDKLGLNKDNVLSLFIPNTYEFYWNTSGEEFMNRMAKEYKSFWTAERKAKAKTADLSQTQVAVLASIVQCEQTVFNDEKSVIAGLYMNRLKKEMPLQSDPTLIYALGDFSIQRVLDKDKDIDSPYNTYKNTGLPPGPICVPEISSLDAVLNYQKNDYIYMCAKEDFSGKHNFSKTYEQHCIYAKKYQKALNDRNIKR
jgi:UPF0755 protein